MSLPELWRNSPDQLQGKHIKQIIGFAGSGQLRDGDPASMEFREFLSMVGSSALEQYASECLESKFEGSGLALQDVLNEVGKRLGFAVTHGRYRGTPGKVGHDGLWRSPESHAVIVEVKTTDVFRLDLNTVANYRRSLVNTGDVVEGHSSILIVVGREETGDLEAQIRGSRDAWDVRLVSVDALLRLMKLKEKTEEPSVHRRIQEILIPVEFTKVDRIVDLVFSASEDVEEEEQVEPEPTAAGTKETGQKAKLAAVSFHEACVARIQSRLGRPLVRRSRTLFATPDDTLRVVVAVSREHDPESAPNYWFAFHPHQEQSLTEASESYVAFGCGSADSVLLITYKEFAKWLDGLWMTQREARTYWHVVIYREGNRFELRRKSGYERVDLTTHFLVGSG